MGSVIEVYHLVVIYLIALFIKHEKQLLCTLVYAVHISYNVWILKKKQNLRHVTSHTNITQENDILRENNFDELCWA